MKKLFFLNYGFKFYLIFAILFLMTFSMGAIEKNKTITSVIAEIRSDLKLGSRDYIDPSNVPDNLLEDLGAIVMNRTFLNDQGLVWRNQALGGKGAVSVEAIDRSAGFNYLANIGDMGFKNNYHRDGADYGPKIGPFSIGKSIM